jgi:hypothetical protein
VGETGAAGEAQDLAFLACFSSSIRLWSSTFDTLMTVRNASVNLTNSGLSGGGFMKI